MLENLHALFKTYLFDTSERLNDNFDGLWENSYMLSQNFTNQTASLTIKTGSVNIRIFFGIQAT